MAKPWYSIKRSPPQASAGEGAAPAEILIYADIGENWWSESVTAQQFVKDLAALDATEITVRINSLGGSVPDGLAIFNALRRHPATITTVNDGMALSIASLILMAGDTVESAENAMTMIHAPWTYAGGNSADLRLAADQLDKWSEAMATSYCAKTGKPVDELMTLLTDGVDHYYTAAEALAEGWVDTVTAAAPAAAVASLRILAQSRFSPQNKTRAQARASVAAATNSQEQYMPGTNPAAEPKPTASNEAQIRAAALAEDTKRREEIRAAAAPFAQREGVTDLVAALCNDTTVSSAAANARILAHLAAGAAPAAGDIHTTEDETDKRIAAQVDALRVRAGLADPETRQRVQAGNPFRADSLLDLARASLDRAGISHRGMTKLEVAAAAFTISTGDFPVLLENTLHKVLQSAYATAPDTWRRFCSIGSVADFRDHNRYRVGSLSNLDGKNELGEFKNKTIPDGEKGSIRVGTKGNVINISRELVINDDLGALLGLADQLGRAAKRTIEADVYALLALNDGLGPNLADGKPLFDASHKNLGTGSALSVIGLDDDRQLLARQKDVSGNDYLDLRPAVLLVSLALGGTARVINASEYDPDTANKLNRPNMARNLFADIVDTPRLSGTRRYLFADPAIAPVIEVAFLDGNQEPYLESQDGFDVDGSRIKIRHDYGIAAIDYRGGVTNAGA